MLIGRFAVAFLLTDLVESIAAYVIGYKGKLFYGVLFLTNLISNPALNYILGIIHIFKLYNLYHAAGIVLEFAVVIFEWRVLYSVFKTDSKRFLLLSTVMNCASYGAGMLLDILGFWKLF